MKKHLLGFALFNLIVGTALVIALLTGRFSSPRTNYTYDVSKQSCWKNVRQNSVSRQNYENSEDSVKITQAVYSERTGKLNMSFALQRETPSTQDVTVKLTFINAVSKGDKNWDIDGRSENITISPNFNVDNQAVYSMPLSYNWLNKFGKKDNFYVKAEIFGGNSTGFETVSRSSFKEFTPILITDKK